jgi:hypothetical protein
MLDGCNAGRERKLRRLPYRGAHETIARECGDDGASDEAGRAGYQHSRGFGHRRAT